MDRHRLALTALAVLPLAFLGIFYIYPLGAIFASSFFIDGTWRLGAIREVLTRSAFLEVAWFTTWQALVSTLLTLVVAMPATHVLARYEFRGKRLARALVTVPFVLPTVVVGSAFLALAGPSGSLGVDLSRTVWIILIAHVFYNYAVVVRTVGALWTHLAPDIEEAARVLGAGRVRTFTHVTLPLLRPAIATAAAIVFLFSFTSFGVILILGDLRQVTLEVEIYRQAINLVDFSVAAALALLQLLAVAAILLIYSRRQEGVQYKLARSGRARRPRNRSERLYVGATLGFTTLFLGAPLAVLVGRSLAGGLTAYADLVNPPVPSLVDPAEAIVNSLWIGLAATAIAVVVGVAAASFITYTRSRVSRWFDVLLLLPLGTSAVTIGFGLLVALDWPVDLRRSVWLIPIGHALIAIPFVVRTAVPVMRSVQANLREAATMLGASPARVWREIDLPIVTRATTVAAGFAFAISLGEFGATSFIARPDTPTMPIALFRLLGRPGAGNFAQAMALATVLMVVTAVAVLLIERFRVGELGEF
jgi:thiamine transport system permease protein